MPRAGAYMLCEYPLEMVRFECPKCGRKGQYRKSTLIEKYGEEICLPHLLSVVANCESPHYWDMCKARFADKLETRTMKIRY